MDLNRLYLEHQSLQMKADAADSFAARTSHTEHAAELAGRIARIQVKLGAAAAASWTALAAKTAATERPAGSGRNMQAPAAVNYLGIEGTVS